MIYLLLAGIFLAILWPGAVRVSAVYMLYAAIAAGVFLVWIYLIEVLS